ncbi:MAG: tetratricopeptide repeat protein [Neisseriales bacterium]|nr:MAG: tetratricopeptide repeat protein [Neisseriales bacterium]
MIINSNQNILLPSTFMRKLRPEYYSDTEDQADYILEATTLEYQLDSITSRNQTNDFEIFCRKLCEKTICPNLRAHTGPDGGGDSKVDTETYIVDKEISDLFYVGDPTVAEEKWAFAFSANKDWKTKIKIDVKKISETNRGYKKIFCITNQFARDKARVELEDTLSQQYNIVVTIHDRSWIIKEIIENNRKDIAYNYLKIGELEKNRFKIGSLDYSRKKQLAEIEKNLNDPDAFKGIERQLVTEALLAAKLSREIECTRVDTEGRFTRAIRLAEKEGTDRQTLEAKYEYIWTAFWWFDDFQFLKNSYNAFETLALQSEQHINLELLTNLLQLLVNAIMHGHMSRDECNLDKHMMNLERALKKIAEYKERPNSALEARTLLVMIDMDRALLDNNREKLVDIWNNYSTLLEKAEGLGEYGAERLVKMIEIAGCITSNDPTYNRLIEKVANFISKRKSEAEGSLVLLRRAQKLNVDSNNFEVIRLLGKAALGLTKREYSNSLIQTLQLLVLAYHYSGLFWAARASCTFLAASFIVKSEENGQLPIDFISTIKTLAWIALRLCHIPDFLFAVQTLRKALTTTQWNIDVKQQIRKSIQDLDEELGGLLLNLNETELSKLESLPDILNALELSTAQSALLYMLGHTNNTSLANHFAEKNIHIPLILNVDGPQIFSTIIFGVNIEIIIDGNAQSIIIAESVLSSLEAFFATSIEQRIAPHTEKLKLFVVESAAISKPFFEIRKLDMSGTINWPINFSLSNLENQEEIHKFWIEISNDVLVTCFIAENLEYFTKQLYDDDVVQNRMKMVAFNSVSYDRISAKSISRISDWQNYIQRIYKLRSPCPTFKTTPPIKNDDHKSQNENKKLCMQHHHQAYKIESIINVHCWDQAKWRGTSYHYYLDSFPYISFIFSDEKSGRRIFVDWQKQFGKIDKNDAISLSIIRQPPKRNQHHYCVKYPQNSLKMETFKPIK